MYDSETQEVNQKFHSLRISKLQHREETPKENTLRVLAELPRRRRPQGQAGEEVGGLIPKKELDREGAPSRDHQSIPKDCLRSHLCLRVRMLGRWGKVYLKEQKDDPLKLAEGLD